MSLSFDRAQLIHRAMRRYTVTMVTVTGSVSVSCAVSVSVSAFFAVGVSLVIRESAVTWSRSAMGAVTMMTRHPITLRAHTS